MEDNLNEIRLNHVGILVSDREKFKKVYEDLGLQFSFDDQVPEEEVQISVFSVKTEGFSQIEIIEPIGEDSPLMKILEKRGEGLHHLCFSVKNLKKKCEELKIKGYHLVYESPSPGAKNSMINFIHPKSTGGVLIELTQQFEE